MGRFKLGSVGTDFDARHWLSLDPCGLICLSFSYSLHIFALFASGFTLIRHHLAAQLLYGTLYVPLSFMALWSLFAASTTNPGAVPMGARPLPVNLGPGGEDDSIIVERDYVRGGLRRRRGVRRCAKCKDNYKPVRAHHDSVTGRCIVKMDHYCPWVGNAVGIMNHKVRLCCMISLRMMMLMMMLLNGIAIICLVVRACICTFKCRALFLGYTLSRLSRSLLILHIIISCIITPLLFHNKVLRFLHLLHAVNRHCFPDVDHITSYSMRILHATTTWISS